MNKAAAVIALSLAAGASARGEATPITGQVMCCEQAKHRLLLLDCASEWSEASQGVWSWDAQGSPHIARDHVKWFGYPAEAKPVLGGSHVLATFSHGAVALIRLHDNQVAFYAEVGGNPHSADLLPDGNIVTASSEGGYLRLFRTEPALGGTPDAPKFIQVPFHDAHGVVWDAGRQFIWALGGRELKRFRYDAAKPDLAEEASYIVPGEKDGKEPGGHDLRFTVSGDRLFVTTMRNVYLFDPDAGTFAPYPPLAETNSVKSIGEQSAGGPVLIMRATEKWYSDTLRFVGRDDVKRMPGARFYKARWWPTGE